ncbi:glucose-1-phosphate adenylyltransferase subunit GlgD [Gracilibacillus salinarum]|uniref:Glucose-1-phosphate adenylyltransferase subunit GlgD n=1 Tax=Gracilibacillus salinarum TaxID=2932255 RepID=A0ABY4GRA1_9BACI|nr:glucose-1-phosphate adenylyltransferase subunit GlgD [Gracilibacillus salinarum]UOQ86192.1 glucose-1-phosphate adenylyltransferase subunit GlgD [Gracilibacillus salinarum]
MKTMIGLINLEHEYDFLNELTYFRCGAATPFAGRYRLIDFTLSNMTKSYMNEIAIFAKHKYRSLIDHLGSGADWDLNKRHGGLFILPPQWHDPHDVSKGDLRHFRNNWDFFERCKSEYVLISGSQFISNMHYNHLFEQHLGSGADVTILTSQYDLKPEHTSCLKVEADDQGNVTAFTNDTKNNHVYTGVYLLRKSLLYSLMEECIANNKSNFFLDGIQNNLDRLKIQVYNYQGYSMIVNSIDSYYRQNLSLLDSDNYQQLFPNGERVYTKIGNQPPTKYNSSAKIAKSLIATGGIINGEVENSILFRGVKVGKGAKIKNSIILQHCKIEDGAHIENVILDKDVTVTEDQLLKGAKEQPFIIAKRSTV